MRRAFVVLVLLAMMVGLKALKTETVSGADPLTLAAIGFVVLAAFAVAELGSRLSLPKVTGYIVSGVVLGPYAVQVLSGEVVVEMTMFSKLALGLIATSAGLELDLRGLRALAKTLAVTTVIKLVGGLLLVGGVFVLGESLLGLMGIESMSTQVALALVFAALSVGTSPSIALAIISENRAKGRLTDLVLGAAVVKDVVVVVALAIAIAIAKALVPELAEESGGEGGATAVLLHVGEELGASILAGAVLGGLLIAYLRWIKAEMLLFVASMVLVVAEVSEVLHLELLLVFIVAGLVVRNFSEYEHDLLHPLEMVSLPVFIVFFTNAGAAVNLPATFEVLPLALAMCVGRTLVFVVAGRVGSRLGGESEQIQRLAWLAYLPQAGVTLGLVGLASTQLPALAPAILTLGMAIVSVNLLIGPITLRVALRGAGEIGDEAASTVDADTTQEEVAPAGAPWEDLEAEALRQIVREVFEADRTALRNFTDAQVEPWMRLRVERLTQPLDDAPTGDAGLEAIEHVLERLPPDDAPARVEAAMDLLARSSAALEELPTEVTVPLEERWRRTQPGDSTSVALRKWAARVRDALRLRFRGRTRTLPPRMAARTVVEPRLARGIEEAISGWYRVEARMLEELRRCALGTRTTAEAVDAIRTHGERFVSDLRGDLEVVADRTARALATELGRVGSPVRSASEIRYSKVEPDQVRWRQRVLDDARAWGSRRDAAARLVRITTEVSLVESRLRRFLDEQVLGVSAEAFELVREECEGQRRRLAQIVENTRALETLDEAAVERLRMEVSAIVPRPAQKRLRAMGGRLRRATSGAAVTNLSREASVEAAGREAIVHSLAALIDVPRPARGEVVTLDISETIQGYLSAELAPRVEELLGELWSAFAVVREAMSTCEGAAEFVLSTAFREGAEDAPTPAALADQLAQTAEPLAGLGDNAAQAWETLRGRMAEAIAGIDEHLVEAIAAAAGRSSNASAKLGRKRRLQLWATNVYARFGAPIAAAIRALIRRARGEAAHGIGRHYRLRSGAERADAADVREYLQAQLKEGVADLPAMYRALFSAEPVRDPRLFVAHRDALQEIVRVERAWQQDAAHGNAVLVVGDAGMGKSSLIQIARLKLATRRVIVVPHRDRAEEGSLVAFLARELSCVADPESIRTVLAKGRTAVVVDDLHEWIPLDASAVTEIDTLLTLVVDTRGSTFWMFSMARPLLESLEPLVPIRAAFAQIVELGRIGAAELDAVLEARQQLSGLDLAFPASLQARVFGRVLRRTLRDTYMRSLAGAARGNPRRALRAWLRRARSETERSITLAPVGVEWGLPFLRQLTATQLGVLALLLRGGRRRPDELAEVLALPPSHVHRALRFLGAAGLVREDDDWIEVPTLVRDDVALALAEFGVAAGGAG